MNERIGELLSLSQGLEKALVDKDWKRAGGLLRVREELLDGLDDNGYLPVKEDEEALRAVLAADERGREILRTQLGELEGKIGKLQDMKKFLKDLLRLGTDQGAAIFDKRG